MVSIKSLNNPSKIVDILFHPILWRQTRPAPSKTKLNSQTGLHLPRFENMAKNHVNANDHQTAIEYLASYLANQQQQDKTQTGGNSHKKQRNKPAPLSISIVLNFISI